MTLMNLCRSKKSLYSYFSHFDDTVPKKEKKNTVKDNPNGAGTGMISTLNHPPKKSQFFQHLRLML